MPRKIEGWGASGMRVLVDATVEFEESPAGESEELVGPLDQTRALSARGGGTVVTLEGEQQVSFESGGWCVQRPMFAKPEKPEWFDSMIDMEKAHRDYLQACKFQEESLKRWVDASKKVDFLSMDGKYVDEKEAKK